MFSVAISTEFEAAHRLLKHQGKCQYLHGHNWEVIVRVGSHALNDHGMVVDFFDIKRLVKTWIGDHLDHGILLNEADPLVEILAQFAKNGHAYTFNDDPTSEVIAKHLYTLFSGHIRDLLGKDMHSLLAVTVRETRRVEATYDGL